MVGLQGRIDDEDDLVRAMIIVGCRQCSAIATRSVGAFAAAHAVAARAEAVIVQGVFFSKAIANVVLEMGEVRTAARTLGLEAITFEIRRAEDTSKRSRAVSRHFISHPTHSRTPTCLRINTLSLGARLPTMYNGREIVVEAGGLMSYGPSFPDLFRRAGDYVDKILRGAKPGDIPFEQPTKFDLVVNLTTAKALGLDVPLHIQQLADEVIE